ncbi:carbohydrate-binding domain-containing protein [Paenibacillus sp. TAB 01]|uniref:carbohydrate-binding domain-containing protein n=1 Tax=Paenibacillus sp. TAB 01 TaxID=3368988 RepID=UPI003752D0A3
MKHSNKAKMMAIVLLSTLLAAGCSSKSAEVSAPAAASTASTPAAAAQLTSLDAAKQAGFGENDTLTSWSKEQSTAILWGTSGASIDGSGAAAEGGVVTITEAGTYVVSGTAAEGQLIVNAPKDAVVHLVLNGTQISSKDSSAIYVKEADRTIVTLPEGTENVVSDGAAYTDTSEDAPTAAIYSKGDLTINGSGKLTVRGNAKDGITGKDDVKLMSGVIDVQAADDGVVGRDLFAVKDGSLTIKAGGDGVKTTNDTDSDKGNIAIAGGTFNITSANDGIQAASSLLIGGGTFHIVSGGGSAASTKTHQEEPPRGFNGSPQGQQKPGAAASAQAQTQADTETESSSGKALKAAKNIAVTDGTFQIDAADDAIHSKANLAITGGQYSLASGDDGIHADTAIAISKGTIDITKSYEGLESLDIAISGGTIHLVSTDDGVNVSGGSSTGTAQGGRGPSSPASGKLTISGGYLYVDAAGDGLDSNGSMVMTGGTALVNGPSNDGNGALDYDGTFEQSGGTLIAAGSSGMAQAPSETSSQRAILMTFPSQLEAGTLVTLTDSSGKQIAAFAPAKTFSSIVVSSPNLLAGTEYTLATGGKAAGTATDGLYDGGSTSGSTKVVTFKLGDTVTYVNSSGVTTANTGEAARRRPRNGRRPRPSG